MMIAYFEADYCGMCHALKETVMRPLEERGIEVVYIDAMEMPAVAETFGVKVLPTAAVIGDGGEVIAVYQGNITQEVLLMHFESD